MNQQVIWFNYDVVTLFVMQQKLSKLTKEEEKSTLRSSFWFKNTKVAKKKLNDDYIIIYHENRISNSVDVTILPN